jgi:hypothetical protein
MNLILLNFPKIFFKYRSLIRAVYIPCQKFDDLFPSTSALHPPAHLTHIELGQETIKFSLKKFLILNLEMEKIC